MRIREQEAARAALTSTNGEGREEKSLLAASTLRQLLLLEAMRPGLRLIGARVCAAHTRSRGQTGLVSLSLHL